MPILKATIAVIMSTFIFACNSSTNTQQQADLILTNGLIYTVEKDQPWVDAVAIKDGKFIHVGKQQHIDSYRGKHTEVIDLKGKMVLPGFVESHAHPLMGGAYINTLSLDTFSNPEIWVQQISDYAQENPDLEVIFGYGFLASAFGPEGATAKQIDSVVNDRPVFIMDEGFHGGWANSRAMEMLGINRDTQDPLPGFSYYKRDSNGNPTGYFLENTASDAVNALGVINKESLTTGLIDVLKVMNGYGITTVFDAGAMEVDGLQVAVLNNIYDKGKFSVRMVASHFIGDESGLKTAVPKTIEKKNSTKHPMYHINTLKIMIDGTIEGRTAGMFEDYQGEPDNQGEIVFTQQQLTDLVSHATAANLDIHIHALGEKAIHQALNAIEAAKKSSPESQTRHAICHVQVIKDEDIQRFYDLGVIAQSTPLWASFDDYGKQFVSDDQFNRYFRFNSLKKAGVKLAFGSDFPATGAGALGISPIYNIEIGHTRQWAGEKDAPIQPNIEERLDIETLIKGYTIDGAYQLHMEDEIGSIKVGKMADLVVLDTNIFKVAPHEINQIKVIRTILGGKTVYQKK